MTLPVPKLDDRTFDQLVQQAHERMRQVSPGWTGDSVSDPGVVLLDAFAHLTETMLYRLNRLPEKAYVAFLGLLGVRLAPPSAARVELKFARAQAAETTIEIPAGTLVTVQRPDAGGEAPLFATVRAAVIRPGQTEVLVPGSHSRWIDEESISGTGEPGQELVARQAPIVAPSSDQPSLVVAVEADPDERPDPARSRLVDGTTFVVWDEVEDFTGASGRRCYVVDRAGGRIIFAPAARMIDDGLLSLEAKPLAVVPPAKRRIRLSYRVGGGLAGNLAASTLTVLKTPIPGLTVTNPTAAGGGRPAETVENALVRGPQEFYSVRRAVTAFDYELLAVRASRQVSRAKAYTRASLYTYAAPGAVDVLLVPAALPGKEGERPTAALLASLQSEDARAQVQAVLDDRRPLGTACQVQWARYKTVHVHARVVVHKHENADLVKRRVLTALDQRLSPMRSTGNNGWGFGETLRVSHLYDMILGRPGVGYVDQVRLQVDEAPDAEVGALAADPFQPRTWYAGSGERLFTSGNDGDGWEPAARFDKARIHRVAPHPEVPGLIALVTHGDGAAIHLSRDCGATWKRIAATDFRVDDLAWSRREGQPLLFLAADAGLYELALTEGSTPIQVLVEAAKPELGFYAVAIASHRGDITVVVAGESLSGLYMSNQGGRAGTFRSIGLKNEDARVLSILREDHRFYLWVGLASVGNDPGKGCLTAELNLSPTQGDAPVGWRWANKGWTGGSCKAIAFCGRRVLAATHRAGVLSFDDAETVQAWKAPFIDCGLPLRPDRDAGPMQPVEALAADVTGRWAFAGGKEGVLRSAGGEPKYATCSRREFADKVLLPETWLFAAGNHEITVASYEEAGM